MNKRDLKKLSKSQLIKMLLKQEKKKPKIIVVDDTKKTNKSKQQKVYNHGNLFNDDPFPEFVVTNDPFENRMIKATNKGIYINEQTSYIDKKYKSIMSSLDDVKPFPKPSERPLQMRKNQNARRPPKPTRKPPPPPIPQVEDHIINVSVPKIKELNKALKGHAKSYGIELQDNLNPLNHFTKTKELVESHLESLLKDKKGFKFIETLEITFEKDSIDSKTGKRVSIYKTAFFNGKAKTITKASDIEHELNMSRQDILNMIDKRVSEGSGWVIDRIDSHYINVPTYTPLHGSSYIELPTELKNPKKGLINIKNKDDECFRWCHIRQLNPQTEHPERIKKEDKKMVNELNYDGIDFPLSQKHYNKVEKQNNIRINVFGYEKGLPFPIHISKETFEDQMNLLLITEDEKKHYVLIKNFNAFMYNQSKHKERKHFCMYCLQCFSSERILANHVNNCLTINGAQAINMPKQGENILKFNNFHKQLPVPFVIYADFEAITKKIQGCKQSEEMEDEKNKTSYTEAYQTHEDCGYGYKLVCCYDDKYSKSIQTYRGENAVYKFMEKMLEEVKYCKAVVKKRFNKPLVMTEDDEMCFKLMDKCHIYGEKYTDKDVRVRDHCHITGKFRGSAHQECNLKLRIKPENLKIPVVFHNLRSYDGSFIMQQIGEIAKKHAYTNKKGEKQDLNINAVPNNMEKYMAFMLGNNLTFIDSFQFMSSSLDKLISNLPKDDLIYTSQVFKGKRLNLMSQKGVYPYDFMDSFDQTELPIKDQFYSILNDQHITDDEYDHAKKVWKVFKIKTMGEYHDLYLGSDVLLLADVFESFRKTCMEYYKLDPCHYFTSPGLSWDAMLKMTNIKLELMTDIDMFQFIEKGMRGGVSYIAHRYGKANNKYMKEYDEKAPSKYIMYLDANNLYGRAMSQYLPTGNFKWISDKEIKRIDLGKYKADGKKGFILEVDLEYPQELHDLHNDYPLAPEKTKVSSGMLSEYCKKIADKYNISIGLVNKLIPTLREKEGYVLHYRNLQLYLDLGLKIKKVHRVLKFNQSPWLKQYIDFNTEKRKHAKNSFEKDFFKLMNNSVFGKTMENLRKRVDVRLVTNENKLLKLTSKPTYVSSKIFNENLVAVHKIKETLTLNRPAYVGASILDLSKTLMYDFHYNYIKKKYVDKARLLFTDTDSLTYEIEAEDVYKDFWNDKDKFDNSDYNKSSPYFDKTNIKVLCKFKDEAAGVPICEFVGLKSKMYSYVKDNEKGGRTAKGIRKNVIKNNIKHEDYKRTLLNNEQMHHKMKTIRSQRHQLGSYEINKVSLSCFDDKRYIHDNGTSSYAYGHYKI